MSELIVAGPVIGFTVLAPIVIVAILARFLKAREDVPLEH